MRKSLFLKMNVAFELVSTHARAPFFSTMHSAAYDFTSNSDDILLKPNEIAKIHTGVIVTWDNPNVVLELKEKSGLALRGVEIKGGIIDYDYRQEVIAIVKNGSNDSIWIEYGKLICQGVFRERPMVNTHSLVATNQYGTVVLGEYFPYSTNQRTGGFGSTGNI